MAGATLDLDVLIEDDAWTAALPDVVALCRKAACAAHTHVAAARGAGSGPSEACLLLADDAQVHRLNKEFRGCDTPTDVLSFPAAEPGAPAAGGAGAPPAVMGDIVVAYGVAAACAQEEDKTLADHLSHLVIHAMLHLWGYDHETVADAAGMETLEIEILGILGIADPYAAADEH